MASRTKDCPGEGCATKILTTSEQCKPCYLKSVGRVSHLASPAIRGPQTYDEAVARFNQFIGQTVPNPTPKKRLKFSDERIVNCSDFHAPFQNDAALAALCKVEADTCILAGDLQDHYSISRFLKYETVPISQELAAAKMILGQLSHHFPTVLAFEGNHDSSRFIKLLADRLPHDAIDIIRFLSSTSGLSTMEVLCRQFRNVELVKHKVGSHDIGWFFQKGDMIVAHAEKYSSVPGSALRKIEDWFSDFEHTLGLNPWRVIVQAHTHAMAHMPYGADKVLVETGCMCMTHGYQLTARIGGRPQRIGWSRLVQRDGVTDLSSIGLHWWQGAEAAA